MSLPDRLSGRAGAIAHGAALCRERLALALGVEASLLHRAEAGDALLMAATTVRMARSLGCKPWALLPTLAELATATQIAELDAAAALHDL